MFLLDQWKKVLNKLENEVTVVTFDLWVNTLTPIQYANDELILMAPSVNAKNQVNQPGLLEKITNCVRAEFTPYTFVRVTEKQEYEESIKKQERELDKLITDRKIIAKYGTGAQLDSIDKKISNYTSKTLELVNMLPTSELKRQVEAINR